MLRMIYTAAGQNNTLIMMMLSSEQPTNKSKTNEIKTAEIDKRIKLNLNYSMITHQCDAVYRAFSICKLSNVNVSNSYTPELSYTKLCVNAFIHQHHSIQTTFAMSGYISYYSFTRRKTKGEKKTTRFSVITNVVFPFWFEHQFLRAYFFRIKPQLRAHREKAFRPITSRITMCRWERHISRADCSWQYHVGDRESQQRSIIIHCDDINTRFKPEFASVSELRHQWIACNSCLT